VHVHVCACVCYMFLPHICFSLCTTSNRYKVTWQLASNKTYSCYDNYAWPLVMETSLTNAVIRSEASTCSKSATATYATRGQHCMSIWPQHIIFVFFFPSRIV